MASSMEDKNKGDYYGEYSRRMLIVDIITLRKKMFEDYKWAYIF